MRNLIAKSEIVEVYEDGLRCVLCGKDLEVAGTHFVRMHGIGGGGLAKSERLLLYGLPQGTRLASARSRSVHRDHAIERGAIHNARAGMTRSSRDYIADAKAAQMRLGPSLRQIEAGRRAGRSSAAPQVNKTPEGRARISAGLRGYSDAHRVERECEQCGRRFRKTLHRVSTEPVKFCSARCYHASRPVVIETKTCVVCSGEFQATAGVAHNARRRVCSPECAGRAVSAARAKLTVEQVLEMRRRAQGGEFGERLAAEYGVTASTANEAIAGRTFKHLPGALGSRAGCQVKPKGQCSVEGCGRPHKSRGMCGAHLIRERRMLKRVRLATEKAATG